MIFLSDSKDKQSQKKCFRIIQQINMRLTNFKQLVTCESHVTVVTDSKKQ